MEKGCVIPQWVMGSNTVRNAQAENSSLHGPILPTASQIGSVTKTGPGFDVCYTRMYLSCKAELSKWFHSFWFLQIEPLLIRGDQYMVGQEVKVQDFNPSCVKVSFIHLLINLTKVTKYLLCVSTVLSPGDIMESNEDTVPTFLAPIRCNSVTKQIHFSPVKWGCTKY